MLLMITECRKMNRFSKQWQRQSRSHFKQGWKVQAFPETMQRKCASNEWEFSYPFAHWLGNNTIVDGKERSELPLLTPRVMRMILWVPVTGCSKGSFLWELCQCRLRAMCCYLQSFTCSVGFMGGYKEENFRPDTKNTGKYFPFKTQFCILFLFFCLEFNDPLFKNFSCLRRKV